MSFSPTNFARDFGHGGYVEYRRPKPRAAWINLRHLSPTYVEPVVPDGRDVAVMRVLERELKHHAAVFRQAMLEVIDGLGLSAADGHLTFPDTSVKLAQWEIDETGNLVVSEDVYDIELTTSVTPGTKDEDAAFILLMSLQHARNEALQARYARLLHDVLHAA